MRFLRRHKESRSVIAPTATVVPTVASSDDLSDLLGDLNDTRIADEAGALAALAAPPAEFLDTDSLLKQGKIHKQQVLLSWVACQSFLSQAELDARSRLPSLRTTRSGNETTTYSETTSRSAMTSRTSNATSAGRPESDGHKHGTSRPSAITSVVKPRRYQLRSRHSIHRSRPIETCQGVPYESLESFGSTFLLIHDDSARVEEEWRKLERTWRGALHIAGPVKSKKRIVTTRT